MNENYEIIEIPKDEYNKLYCDLLYYYNYYKYELNEYANITSEMTYRMWCNNNRFNTYN